MRPSASCHLATLALLAGLAAAPVHGQVAAVHPDSRAPAGPEASTGDALHAGDRIRLSIWREPDLSGDFTIAESGIVTLPKLGPMDVSGSHPDSVRAAIVSGYARYLVNPSIEVVFVRRVQVVGEVRNPNLYYADETMTVGDVLALAGGTSDRAKLSGIRIVRDGERLPVHLAQSATIGDAEIRSGDQIVVPRRSWISRNPGLVIGIASTLATIITRIATAR